jgi:hypothetical protein
MACQPALPARLLGVTVGCCVDALVWEQEPLLWLMPLRRQELLLVKASPRGS